MIDMTAATISLHDAILTAPVRRSPTGPAGREQRNQRHPGRRTARHPPIAFLAMGRLQHLVGQHLDRCLARGLRDELHSHGCRMRAGDCCVVLRRWPREPRGHAGVCPDDGHLAHRIRRARQCGADLCLVSRLRWMGDRRRRHHGAGGEHGLRPTRMAQRRCCRGRGLRCRRWRRHGRRSLRIQARHSISERRDSREHCDDHCLHRSHDRQRELDVTWPHRPGVSRGLHWSRSDRRRSLRPLVDEQRSRLLAIPAEGFVGQGHRRLDDLRGEPDAVSSRHLRAHARHVRPEPCRAAGHQSHRRIDVAAADQRVDPPALPPRAFARRDGGRLHGPLLLRPDAAHPRAQGPSGGCRRARRSAHDPRQPVPRLVRRVVLRPVRGLPHLPRGAAGCLVGRIHCRRHLPPAGLLERRHVRRAWTLWIGGLARARQHDRGNVRGLRPCHLEHQRYDSRLAGVLFRHLRGS